MTEAGVDFTVERGKGLEPHLEAIARLRIEVFREWPYLYEGSVEYERDYLADYVRCPQSAVVLAWDGNELVGASTSLPLAAADADFQAPFAQKGLDPERYFYLAESVLRRPYRGQGAGHRFFDAREAAARESGFAQATFCAVIRPDDHPARPAHYRPLDGFWRKRGYERAEGLVCHYHWPDLGEAEETWKPLQFWWRSL